MTAQLSCVDSSWPPCLPRVRRQSGIDLPLAEPPVPLTPYSHTRATGQVRHATVAALQYWFPLAFLGARWTSDRLALSCAAGPVPRNGHQRGDAEIARCDLPQPSRGEDMAVGIVKWFNAEKGFGFI